MLRFLLWIAPVAAALVLLWNGFCTAELAGRFEVAARSAEREKQAAQQEAAAAAVDNERLRADIARLEGELDRSLQFSNALGQSLVRESTLREQRAVQVAARAALVAVPPPVGVQSCLDGFAACLRADGFSGLRLLSARTLQDGVLGDVEFLQFGAGDTQGEVIVAARMTARLRRDQGELVLAFAEGFRRAQGVRAELPDGGHEIRLQPVTGRLWEQRLPYLVAAEGEYPATAGDDMPRDAGIDPLARAEWLERFDQLLGEAGTDLRLRVSGFRSVQGAEFRDARLFGYDAGNLLALAADVAGLAVELDDRAGIVSLRLVDGTLRRDGTESTIRADGYRMFLPNVTPERAQHLMMGMVVHR